MAVTAIGVILAQLAAIEIELASETSPRIGSPKHIATKIGSATSETIGPINTAAASLKTGGTSIPIEPVPGLAGQAH